MSNVRTEIKRTSAFTTAPIAIFLIRGYQTLISPLLHSLLGTKNACRMEQSCSDYAIDVIRRYGIGRGMVLSVRRFVNCQPLFKI